jgi:transcription initiation factor TFIIB
VAACIRYLVDSGQAQSQPRPQLTCLSNPSLYNSLAARPQHKFCPISAFSKRKNSRHIAQDSGLGTLDSGLGTGDLRSTAVIQRPLNLYQDTHTTHIHDTAATMAMSFAEADAAMLPPADEQYHQSYAFKLTCSDCKEDPPNLVEEFSSGDLVCGSCGLVLQNHILDNRSEWRTFSNDDQGGDDPSRVGDAANSLLQGSQLTTEIAKTTDIRFRDLSRAHNRATEHKGNKALTNAYSHISSICDRLHASNNIGNHAKQIYKMLDESGKFKAKSLEVMTAVCIFVALRQENAGRSFKEVNRVARVQKKELGRTFKLAQDYLRKKGMQGGGAPGTTYVYEAAPTTGPKDMCNRFGSTLGLPPNVYLMAGECADLMLSDGPLAGRSPLSVAALALYAISGFMHMQKTSKEVGEVCQVSDGTIRGTWRKIHAAKDQFIKKEWIEERGGDLSKLPPP